MTGPDINRPVPPVTPLGSFPYGVTPPFTDIPFDAWRTIISQYANSPIITTLIENFESYIDQTGDFLALWQDIWNIDTAQGIGLDIWGRILGVTRVLQIAVSAAYFGFNEASAPATFGQATFWTGTSATGNFFMSDDAFRRVLLTKALFNITSGSTQAMNTLLLTLFPGRGNCYVIDGLNNTMTYVFQFTLSPVELAIVTQSGVLPRTAGVSASIISSNNPVTRISRSYIETR